jgi:multiple sugar transport system permease protein
MPHLARKVEVRERTGHAQQHPRGRPRRDAGNPVTAAAPARAAKVAPEPGRGDEERIKYLQKRAKKVNRREAIAGYLFISPWIVGFLIFTLGAMLYSLYISFSHYNLALGRIRPAGFDNYDQLIQDPDVLRSLGNTLYYAVLAVPCEIIFALFLAMLLNRLGRSAGVFRTLFYLPKMTPAVATASIFFLLLNGNQGVVNAVLGFFGIDGPNWLVDPAWIKPSLVLMTLWGVSGTMLIFLAALKNVPRDLYEVAELDGAGPVRRFFNITVPMISPTIFFNVIVLTIAALQVFDTAYLLFSRDQGQATPDAALFYAIYLFQLAFRQFNFGLASAMAWLLFVIILIITLIQTRIGNRFVYYEGDNS